MKLNVKNKLFNEKILSFYKKTWNLQVDYHTLNLMNCIYLKKVLTSFVINHLRFTNDASGNIYHVWTGAKT